MCSGFLWEAEMLPSMADDVRSGTTGPGPVILPPAPLPDPDPVPLTEGIEVAVFPDMAVGGRETAAELSGGEMAAAAGERSPSTREKAEDCISERSATRAAPAAAIICGLRGLEEVLATLPFRECCMPCTMEVWRWCP